MKTVQMQIGQLVKLTKCHFLFFENKHTPCAPEIIRQSTNRIGLAVGASEDGHRTPEQWRYARFLNYFHPLGNWSSPLNDKAAQRERQSCVCIGALRLRCPGGSI